MRPSTESTIQAGIGYAVILLVGLFLMLGGAAVVAMEYKVPPPHTSHIAIGGGVSVFGALLLLIGLAKKQGTTVLQTIIVNVSPFVPRFGGRRKEDPPAEIEIPPKAEP